jgi:hypothetical protein
VDLQAGIEGLEAIKPRLSNKLIGNRKLCNNQSGVGLNNTNAIGDQGVDVEATMVLGEDEIEGTKWMMDNVKFSVKEPVGTLVSVFVQTCLELAALTLTIYIHLNMQIEAVAKKEELEHLAMICRSEADAMGRITAGILRLLKLDKSLGHGTIEQLRNLGME